MDISEFSNEPASLLPIGGPSSPRSPLLSHDIEIDYDDDSVSHEVLYVRADTRSHETQTNETSHQWALAEKGMLRAC
jgi:hypothetical protein